ncbi:MAG: heme ABC transporter ATP-binding protein [Dehalococcoidales bacterium]|nr:heme ABC transporter ATP-binding protein [Dehalococcoidales bacterium]
MVKLEISNISLSYNHHPVVQGLSFQVRPGEMVGLIGPNGCGKTSIIKALSRILSPITGRITLDGRETRQISRQEFARLIGVVPQNPSLPDTFTVAEVVLLGRNPHLGFLRNESARDLAICYWSMQRTGVEALAERKMSELSGGERQRVTIARVLAQEPKAILLDEPTANLDIKHEIDILALIKGLCREKNMAVLIALHDLNLAVQYCDRLLMIKGGRIYAEGTPQTVITTANIKEVYETDSVVYPHPENDLPVIMVKGIKN